MSETYRTTPPDQQWSNGDYTGAHSERQDDASSPEFGKALIVGVLGGLLSAAGYLVFQRLPEDQKERLQSQAKQLLQDRIGEVRRNFNL
ncbi:MAG TPA: hypothetical protein VGR69_11400 [Candidatus Rubrimentiphilum sp.]|nr:hypothetical protein [Candidatus Rubrimentiphilum sp.]